MQSNYKKSCEIQVGNKRGKQEQQSSIFQGYVIKLQDKGIY